MKKILFFPFFLLNLNLVAQDTPTVAPQITTDSLNKSLNLLKKDVDVLKNLKVNGWVQAQFQYADTAGAKGFDGGDFLAATNNRFMIRRGRVKFTYTGKNSQYVLQINATERGVNLVDFYGKYTDPWMHSLSLTVGVMNRPFGFEIQQSSADRETPERSRFTQILLPNERDCGAMLTFQPPKGKALYGLKVDAGFYNGTGIAVPGTTSLNGAGVTDFDYIKDFIGRIHYNKSLKEDKIKFGIGVSHYNGGYVYQNNKVYNSIVKDTSGNMVWKIADTIQKNYRNTMAPRVYYGADFQFSIKSVIGVTSIRCEYITGTQTGKDVDSKSPASLPSATGATFIRNFNGGYAYFIQRIGKSKHELAVKYEFFDPNTKIAAGDLNGKNGMKEGEIKWTALGLGYNLYVTDNVKFMFHYNMVSNEVVKISGYTHDLKDNVFTARLQYRF